MKIRIKFSKQGAMKFVGHLDIMRYFQKAMRRADVDICYSGGFSPHQIMSFAAPLGVGLTSRGEYLDIEVNSSKSSQEMVLQLNDVMAEGIRVLSFVKLNDDAKTAMSLVAAADYTVSFRKGYEPEEWSQFASDFENFCSRPQILFEKKTKKGSREVDLKPLIYNMEVRNSDIFMQVSAGSTDNVKPELIFEAFCQYIGKELSPFALMVQREEVYADLGTEQERKLCPLDSMGEIITQEITGEA